MRVVEGRDYIAKAKEAEIILAEQGESKETLSSQAELLLTTIVARAKMLERIYREKGVYFAVANNNSNPHVAAFVTLHDAKPHFTESTLDQSYSQVSKIVTHELIHVEDIREGKRSIDLRKNIQGSYRLKTLNRAVGDLLTPACNDIAEVNLIEGLTECRSADCKGENCNCAYNEFEVPIVRRLDKLAKDILGISLIEAYKAGLYFFYEQLKSLCDALAVREVIKSLRNDEGRERLDGVGDINIARNRKKAKELLESIKETEGISAAVREKIAEGLGWNFDQ